MSGVEAANMAVLPPSLRAKAELIVDGMSAVNSDNSATDFGEGQISGPYGPRFVGFGPVPRMTLTERWGATAALAAAIATASALLMLLV